MKLINAGQHELVKKPFSASSSDSAYATMSDAESGFDNRVEAKPLSPFMT